MTRPETITIDGRALPIITGHQYDAMRADYAAAYAADHPGTSFNAGGYTTVHLDTPETGHPHGYHVTRREQYWLAYIGDNDYVGYIRHRRPPTWHADYCGRYHARSTIDGATAVANVRRRMARATT